jgi:hypothetical protein
LSPLDRYFALTLCMEVAIKENRFQEVPSLIEARSKIIGELAASGQGLPEDRLATIKDAETRLMAGLKARRNATLERLSQLRSVKNARNTYSRSF